MIDVAGAAVDDGADLALPVADGGGNTAEIGHLVDALQHDDVACFGKIMRFDLAEARHAGFDFFGSRRIRRHVAHRQRPADDARFRIGRAEHRGRHGADDAELVHGVGSDAGEIGQRAKTVENIGRQHRQLQHAEGVRRKLAERLFRHGKKLKIRTAWSDCRPA